MGATQSPQMKEALKLIMGPRKLTAAEASREAGISKGAISKNAQYRAHVEEKKNAAKAT